MAALRLDGRTPSQLRPVSFERGVSRYAEGSCLVRWGNTEVFCTASVEEKVPSFMRGLGRGWVTAEYSMLPRATRDRNQRDVNRGKVNGRGCEIQRLVGRSLRAAIDLPRLGERAVTIDCALAAVAAAFFWFCAAVSSCVYVAPELPLVFLLLLLLLELLLPAELPLPPALAGELQPLDDMLASGRTPAHAMIDRFRETGDITTTITAP